MDDRVVYASFFDPHIGLDVGRGTYIVTRYLGDTQFPNASHLYGIDKCQIPAPLPEEPKSSTSHASTAIPANLQGQALACNLSRPTGRFS